MADAIVRKGRGFASGATRYEPATASIGADATGTTTNASRNQDERFRNDNRTTQYARSTQERSHTEKRTSTRRKSRSRSRSRGHGSRSRSRSPQREQRRSRSRSRERDRGRHDRDHGRSSHDIAAPAPDQRQLASAQGGNPQPGSVIALSNTRKTAELVARQSSGSGIVTEDALASLRARMAGMSGAAALMGGGDRNVASAASAAIAALAGGMSSHPDANRLGTVPGMEPSAQELAQRVAQGAATMRSGAGAAISTGGLGMGLGLGMPSGTAIIQAPAGVNVNVGTSPAQAAGMLGPGGLVSLLAAVSPSRILVLYNAVTDVILESGRLDPTSRSSELADLAVDIAAEAQKAAPDSLLRLVIPLPRQQGEQIDPPVGVKLGGALKVVGATGLLEDTREYSIINVSQAGTAQKDGHVVVGANMEGAKVIPMTAEEFYRKVVASGGRAGAGSSGGWSNVEGLPGTMTASGAYGGDEGEEGIVDTGSARTDADGRTRGLGKVYLEFSNVEAAVATQKDLAGRFLEGRITVATFAHPAKFVVGDLCALGPPGAFVLTASNAPTAHLASSAELARTTQNLQEPAETAHLIHVPEHGEDMQTELT